MLIDTEHGTKPRYLTPSICKDFGGNTFVAVIYMDDENQYDGRMRLWKVDPAGNKSLVGERQLSRAKGDGVGICQSGADIIPVMSGHFHDPDTDLELVPAFVGVAVPYPNGTQPGQGGAQAFTETSGSGGGTDVDYDRIQAIIDARIAAWEPGFIGRLRPHIMQKAQEAVRNEKVLRVDSTADEKYSILRHDTKDGAYEAITSYFGPKQQQQPQTGQLGMTAQPEEGANE